MLSRRACDRCHRYKEHCSFDNDAKSCVLCGRSGSRCTTSRLQLRRGRRPKAKSFGPDNSVQIWELASATGTIARATENQKPISDRSQKCSSVIKTTDVQPGYWSSELIDPWICHLQLPDFSANNISDIKAPFDEPTPATLKKFYELYNSFVFGPTFVPIFRTALQDTYMSSPVLLNDILPVMDTVAASACLKRFSWDQNDISKGSVSLQKLRTARIARIQDALAVVALGQSLAAFDLFTNGSGILSILRYSLCSIRPWYGELAKKSVFDTVVITPIFWDTIHCLVKQEVPVVKFFSRGDPVIDRMAGLSTSLLPILYDLCVASVKVKVASHAGDPIDNSSMANLGQRLTLWKPSPPLDFMSTFSDQEVLHMTAQVSMYHTASLLIHHRVLNPLGTQDDRALWYANNIMADFDRFSALLVPGSSLKNVTFPVFLAMLETREASDELSKRSAWTNVAPRCVAKLSALIAHVWKNRDCGFVGFLFDLIDSGPEFVVLP